MHYLEAKKIMGQNFIGPLELAKIRNKLKIKNPLLLKVPPVPFNEKLLKKIKSDYLLILGGAKTIKGLPLTINALRNVFGQNPKKAEPCFYNQDWYLKERFAARATLANKWYLLSKTVEPKTRSQAPRDILKNLNKRQALPSAILTAYAFFAYYLLNQGQKLWATDFIWCADYDHNGDQIYTGRYLDPKKINAHGFNVHRHLTIGKIYGLAPEVI